MRLINCRKCGESIEFKGGNHRYCESCSNKTSSHLCHSCGEIIDNYVGHGQKYCKTCSIKIKKEKTRLRRECHRQKHTPICANCGKPIHNYKGHGQKYCKTCSGNIRLENIRLLRLAHYRKWKDVIPPSLGACWLSENPKIDLDDTNFKEEYLAITREKRRLGLDKP